jgi:hypothetical protein
MKRIFIIFSSLFASHIATAQESSDTIVIEKVNKVVVASANNSMSVEVIGKEDDPDYHFIKSLETEADGFNVLRESSSDFDFKFPFSQSYESNRRCEFSIAPTLSVGLVSALGGPSSLDTDFGKSVEITWHAAFIKVFPGSRHWHFSTGLWFNWKNYRMTGNTRFDRTDDGHVVLGPYPENADIRFSRVHTLSYQIPILAHYRISKQIKIAGGVLFNFNGHGNLKTRYSLDGKSIKDRDRNIHLNSFTTDIIGIVSFRNYLGLYFKYSPHNVLDVSRGPKFHGLSTGLIWNW